MGGLALTYFRERKLIIIGAMLFHGPVRDGKGGTSRLLTPGVTCNVCRAVRVNAKLEEGVVIVWGMSCCRLIQGYRINAVRAISIS